MPRGAGVRQRYLVQVPPLLVQIRRTWVSSLPTSALQLLRRKAEGRERSQICQNWSFLIHSTQADAGKVVGEKASEIFNEEVVFSTQSAQEIMSG